MSHPNATARDRELARLATARTKLAAARRDLERLAGLALTQDARDREKGYATSAEELRRHEAFLHEIHQALAWGRQPS